MDRPVVSVCIPAYRAEAFIEETVASALAQSWPVEVVVSIDRGGDGTAGLVRRLGAKRVRVVEQSKRLGWIGNSNAALRLARSEFAMMLPHDDVLAPDYVAACMTALTAQPGSVVAYSDIGIIGRPEVRISEPSEVGPVVARMAAMARGHFDAVAVRGVFSRKLAPHHTVPSAIAGFAADTLWVAQMAAQGAIVRVPELFYLKRLLPDSAHHAWLRATPVELDEMWIVHCVEWLRTIEVLWPDILAVPAFRVALQSRLRREHVGFRGGSGVPRQLQGYPDLLPRMVAVYAEVLRREPSYTWAGATG